MQDRDFDRVEAGSLTAWPCSPRVDADPAFRGIRLTAPGRVTIGAAADPFAPVFARVMVCGALHLDFDYLGARGRFLPRIVLVAVSATTHRVFAARFEPVPNAIPEPPPDPPDPGGWPAGSIIQYWSPNLAELLSLPEEEADYFAHATLGDHVSNVVRIEVRRAGAPEDT